MSLAYYPWAARSLAFDWLLQRRRYLILRFLAEIIARPKSEGQIQGAAH
jgi:hypothetical protein